MFRIVPEDWRVQPLQRSAVTQQAAMVAACITIITVGVVSYFVLSALQQRRGLTRASMPETQQAAPVANAPETIAPKAGDGSLGPERTTAVRASMPETPQSASVAQNAPETIAPKAGDASPDPERTTPVPAPVPVDTILVKVFATAALSQVTTQPQAVKTHFDPLKDQDEVVQILRNGCSHMKQAFDIESINLDD